MINEWLRIHIIAILDLINKINSLGCDWGIHNLSFQRKKKVTSKVTVSLSIFFTSEEGENLMGEVETEKSSLPGIFEGLGELWKSSLDFPLFTQTWVFLRIE